MLLAERMRMGPLVRTVVSASGRSPVRDSAPGGGGYSRAPSKETPP
jgi:hypothetical protein